MGIDNITIEHFEKNVHMFESFIPRYDEIWLFGTGIFAKAFDKYLRTFDVVSEGFVVSSPPEGECKSDKQIIGIAEFKERYEHSGKIGFAPDYIREFDGRGKWLPNKREKHEWLITADSDKPERELL